MSFST